MNEPRLYLNESNSDNRMTKKSLKGLDLTVCFQRFNHRNFKIKCNKISYLNESVHLKYLNEPSSTTKVVSVIAWTSSPMTTSILTALEIRRYYVLLSCYKTV